MHARIKVEVRTPRLVAVAPLNTRQFFTIFFSIQSLKREMFKVWCQCELWRPVDIVTGCWATVLRWNVPLVVAGVVSNDVFAWLYLIANIYRSVSGDNDDHEQMMIPDCWNGTHLRCVGLIFLSSCILLYSSIFSMVLSPAFCRACFKIS